MKKNSIKIMIIFILSSSHLAFGDCNKHIYNYVPGFTFNVYGQKCSTFKCNDEFIGLLPAPKTQNYNDRVIMSFSIDDYETIKFKSLNDGSDVYNIDKADGDCNLADSGAPFVSNSPSGGDITLCTGC